MAWSESCNIFKKKFQLGENKGMFVSISTSLVFTFALLVGNKEENREEVTCGLLYESIQEQWTLQRFSAGVFS